MACTRWMGTKFSHGKYQFILHHELVVLYLKYWFLLLFFSVRNTLLASSSQGGNNGMLLLLYAILKLFIFVSVWFNVCFVLEIEDITVLSMTVDVYDTIA